jgi:hypothetical protein
MKSIVFGMFFLLELIAIAAFSYWGYGIKAGLVVKILLAIAMPLVVIVIWGLYLAPKASYPVFSYPVRTMLKLVVFVFASAALYTAGRHAYGAAYLILSILIVGTVFFMNWHNT